MCPARVDLLTSRSPVHGALLVAVILLLWTFGCSAHHLERAVRPGHSFASGATLHREMGIASWYGDAFDRKPTASGEIFDMHAMTAAHRTLPLGTWVAVRHLRTGRTVWVRINDRGPFVEGRVIDLSFGAAEALGIVESGTAPVEILCPYPSSALEGDLGYWVQVGAYREPDLAASALESLLQRYRSARIVSSAPYHRVRIGPFPEEASAVRVRDALRSEGTEAYVVRDLASLQTSRDPAVR